MKEEPTKTVKEELTADQNEKNVFLETCTGIPAVYITDDKESSKNSSDLEEFSKF